MYLSGCGALASIPSITKKKSTKHTWAYNLLFKSNLIWNITWWLLIVRIYTTFSDTAISSNTWKWSAKLPFPIETSIKTQTSCLCPLPLSFPMWTVENEFLFLYFTTTLWKVKPQNVKENLYRLSKENDNCLFS